jgi:UrcA family protein
MVIRGEAVVLGAVAAAMLLAPISSWGRSSAPELVVRAAAPGPQSRFEMVKYSDLNLDGEAGARTLLWRITGAAGRVCGPDHRESLSEHGAYRLCVDRAVDRAVLEIGKPSVTLLHQNGG